MDCQLQFSFAIFVVCVIALVNGAPPEKIVRGRIAARGEFPYIVSLQKYGQHFCGGAIISKSHILTAAHCVDDITTSEDLSKIRVVTGLNNLYSGEGQTHKIKKAKIHPEFFQGGSFPNDVAVLTLSSPMTFNGYQEKINLPYSDFFDGSQASIAGWGHTSSHGSSSRTLLKINPTINHCNFYPYKDLHVCAMHSPGQDTCQGDSGGPLVVGDKVVGVVSWGRGDCGTGNVDAYANVYHYTDFIRNQMYESYDWL